MKLLMLNYEFPPIGGGAGQAHLAILREFAAYPDLRIDVLTSAPSPGLVVDEMAANIVIHKVGIRKRDLHHWTKPEVLVWLYKARRYLDKLLSEDYDLAHAFFAFPTGWLSYRVADRLPYILSLRGSDVPGHNIRLGLDYKLLAGLFRRIWRRAERIVAVSNGLREEALKFTPELAIDVIPNAIDCTAFKPAAEKTAADQIRLLYVGRMARKKRMDLMLDTFAEARRQGLNLELNIVGQGDLLEKLQKQAVDLGITDQVHFHGRIPREQMPAVYRQNDIFFITSRHEGMSNAMLEAMASGLPIVAAPCEGVDELVGDNGIVVHEPDPANFIAALGKLVHDRAVYDTMAAAARQKALTFCWSTVARQYYQCYEDVLQKMSSS